MAILEVKDLCFSYPDGDSRRVILDHVSAEFEEGKFYAILGSRMWKDDFSIFDCGFGSARGR